MQHFIDVLKAYNGETETLEKFRSLVKEGGKDYLESIVFGEQRSLSKSNLTDREIQVMLSTINWVAENKAQLFVEKQSSPSYTSPPILEED